MTKLVILDRDGVINFDSPHFIKSEAEWLPIPGSLEAIAKLNHAGFTVALATNQSGIARGLYDTSTLNRIHQKMQSALLGLGGHIDGIFVCPHGPDDHCNCRKPKTGLMEQIAKHYELDSQASPPCIGDSLRDLEAAHQFGFRPILVRTGNGSKTLENLPDHLKHVEIVANLAEAALLVMGSTSYMKS